MFDYVKKDVLEEEVKKWRDESALVTEWMLLLAKKLGYEIAEEKTKTIPAHWKKIKK
jgi:hypothetical protein